MTTPYVTDFVRHYEKIFTAFRNQKAELLYKESTNFYNNKKKDSIEPSELLAIKAPSAAAKQQHRRYIGLPEENVHFLNLTILRNWYH